MKYSSENKAKITGIAISGAFELEGHSVIFTTAKDKEQIKITESMRGNTWQTLGRNWSMTRYVPITEAIEEQDKLIKYGYLRTN
jgi:hypothetical protein